MVRRRPARKTPVERPLAPRTALVWVAALLLLHALLAGWAMTRNSVTFDENFHLPAGLMILERGNYTGSVAQPPLPKVLYALPALWMGARLPDEPALLSGDEGTVGESFMRRNWDRYGRIFTAARVVALGFSLLLALLVWRWARRLHGEAGGLLALALYALAPLALAQAGIVGTDLPTALAYAWVLYTTWRYLAAPSWRTWALLALAWAIAFVTRFSAVQLVPAVVAVTAIAQWRGRLPAPRSVWLGLAALAPVAWLAVCASYQFDFPQRAWGELPFRSAAFIEFAKRFPAFAPPLPLAYVGGLDYMLLLNQEASTYLLGRIHDGSVWYYFPLALLFKLPLGSWAALVARAFVRPREADEARVPAGWVMGSAAVVLLFIALFLTRYNFGIRYLMPLLPLACVWCGGLLAPGVGATTRRLAGACVLLLAVETAACAPWFLSFYNWPSGGPGRGDRLVNDSNVDWGQGLIALREEMARRGIRRIQLTYHGTTDPAVYGIDYVPYTGGPLGRDSDWLAVSSYYYVGLGQRMMTQEGRTPPLRVDFAPLWSRTPEARPAGCMYLFKVR